MSSSRKNVRPMALTAQEGREIRDQVNKVLDHLALGREAVRLEVADAARRWAARVDDQEYPGGFEDEPTDELAVGTPVAFSPPLPCSRCGVEFEYLMVLDGRSLCAHCLDMETGR